MFRIKTWMSLVVMACLGGLFAMVGCGDPTTGPEPLGGTDSGQSDSGTPPNDGGPPDAGKQDAGPADSGTPDSGTPDSGTPDAGYVSYATDIQPIFNTHCGPCHTRAAPAPSGALRLDAGTSWAALVNVPLAGGSCTGQGMRVVPGDAGESMLWLKLTNDSRKCGTVMPRTDGGANLIPEEDRRKIFRWIAHGALNN